ncbi:hypothetical protein [Lactococcus lactis]|nr:hypothetical protein [Lactococcus lactis]
MTDTPKRPGGLPTTDKVKNGINRGELVKGVPTNKFPGNFKPKDKKKI